MRSEEFTDLQRRFADANLTNGDLKVRLLGTISILEVLLDQQEVLIKTLSALHKQEPAQKIFQHMTRQLDSMRGLLGTTSSVKKLAPFEGKSDGD